MTFGIDLRDLRYFEAIAELEHLGRAAERLHRTQPALTSAVRRLEEACGAPLFEKSGRGIRLSPAGKVLLQWAQRMRIDVEDAGREIDAVARGLQGEIRIGIVPTAAQYILPGAVTRLFREAPDLRLKTVVGLVDTMKPLLRAGQLDLLIGTESVGDSEFESRFLAEDHIVVAASANHELFSKPRRLSTLAEYRWILQPPGAPTRDWLDRTFMANGLPPPVVQVEASMLVILPALIAETGLLSFVSRHHFHLHATLREIELKATTMRRRLAVSYLRERNLPRAVERLMDVLEATAQQNPAWAE
ncbi:MAG: LysR family transcriptional regulator [Burkholderiaceae bacterium]